MPRLGSRHGAALAASLLLIAAHPVIGSETATTAAAASPRRGARPMPPRHTAQALVTALPSPVARPTATESVAPSGAAAARIDPSTIPTGTLLCRVQVGESGDEQRWSWVVPLLGPALAFLAACLALRWGVRSLRLTYFTKEWSNLVQFLQKDGAKFMDANKTANYKDAFVDEDAVKYEMVARLCIGYLDDLYFLGARSKMKTWFCGSIRLFAGRHRPWLTDNRDAYADSFYEFIIGELDRIAKEEASRGRQASGAAG